MTDKQIKTLEWFSHEQGESSIMCKVDHVFKIPCFGADDMFACFEADPHSLSRMVIATSCGDFEVDGNGEVSFHVDDVYTETEVFGDGFHDADDYDDYDYDDYGYDDYGTRPVTKGKTYVRSGVRRKKATTAMPAVAGKEGNHHRVAKLMRKAGFKVSANNRRFLSSTHRRTMHTTESSATVGNIDIAKVSTKTPLAGMGIVPAGPPAYYSSTAVIYRRCEDQALCKDWEEKFDVSDDKMLKDEGTGAMKSIKAANVKHMNPMVAKKGAMGEQVYLEPFAVEKALKFKTSAGVFSVKYETFKAFPGQASVTLTNPTGTTFKAQILKGSASSASWMHEMLQPGASWHYCQSGKGQTNVDSAPTSVAPEISRSPEDEMMHHLDTDDTVIAHNTQVKKDAETNPDAINELWPKYCGENAASDTQKCGNSDGFTIEECPIPYTNKDYTNSETGTPCYYETWASPTGKDEAESDATGIPWYRGHTDDCNPKFLQGHLTPDADKKCVKTFPIKKFSILTSGKGVDMLYSETEAGDYATATGEFKPVAGAGSPLPYEIEAPSLGYAKQYTFIKALKPDELPSMLDMAKLKKLFAFQNLTAECRRTEQDTVPPPFINPAARVAPGAAGGEAIDTLVGTTVAAGTVSTEEYMTLTAAQFLSTTRMDATCPQACQDYSALNGGTEAACVAALSSNAVRTFKCVSSMLSAGSSGNGYTYKNDIMCDCKATTVSSTEVKFQIKTTHDEFDILSSPSAMAASGSGSGSGYASVFAPAGIAKFKGKVERANSGTTNKLGEMIWTHNTSALSLHLLKDIQSGLKSFVPMPYARTLRNGQILKIKSHYQPAQLSSFDKKLKPAFALQADLFFSSRGGGAPLARELDPVDGLGRDGQGRMEDRMELETGPPAELSNMDLSVSVLIEATTTCKNSKLVQGLKARVAYALKTQVVYPYKETRHANGTPVTQKHAMCVDTPVPERNPAGSGSQAGARAAKTSQKSKDNTFPGSRKLLQKAPAAASGSGSGSGYDYDYDYDYGYGEYDEEEFVDASGVAVPMTMMTTCMQVEKIGVQWKTGVLPIDFADSKMLMDLIEKEIPGTSC